MDKIRKIIIKWLLGEDWEEYWDLHRKYCEEIKTNIELLEENQKLTTRLIENNERVIILCDEMTEYLNSLKQNT